jgi:hypothetical protein
MLVTVVKSLPTSQKNKPKMTLSWIPKFWALIPPVRPLENLRLDGRIIQCSQWLAAAWLFNLEARPHEYNWSRIRLTLLHLIYYLMIMFVSYT